MDLEVAVIIPVYNAGRFVEKAVASALAFPEVKEVVLAEDASPDDSLAVCHRLAGTDPRIKLVRHPDGGNHGAAATRDLGFASSSSPFVAFLDADDRFLPNRFDAERRIFAEHPDADGVYGATGVEYHDTEGRERFQAQFDHELTTVTQVLPPERLFSALLGSIKGVGYFHLDALTVRRSALDRMGPLFDPALRLHQDTLFVLRLAHGARLYPGVVGTAVSLRGVHASNRITANKDLAASKYLLHCRLEDWSRGVELPRDDRRLIVAKRVYWQMLRARGSFSRTFQLRHFVVHPWLFQWVQVREAWLDGVFGRDSTLSRRLRSLAWRTGSNVLSSIS
ncbi:MAG: glycosyltransferase family 2 protein [Flavobacteriales bacterium]|jgi:glycosyltransferase involved in cell wall biosynthesis